MIKTIKLILAMSIISTLFGCKTQKLATEDKSWQPYKKGDILIFKSNKNKKDSIFVNKIESHFNPKDPLSSTNEKFETLFVSGDITLQKPKKTKLGRIFNKEKIGILEMTLDESNKYLKFVFKKKSDTLKYPTTVLTLNELKNKVNRKKDIKAFNSIEIEAKEYYDLPFKFDLKNFWWSKNFGYVRYEFKNGEYWELKEFVRDGINILK
jgi:hypothetical protein